MTAALAELSDGELAALWDGTDETWHADILAEAERRDREAQARPRTIAAAERDDWDAVAEAAYLAADEACKGNLLSRRGIRAGVSERSLWTGPEARARAYASEELLEHWAKAGRTTISEYRAGLAADRRDEREAAEIAAAMAADIPDEAEPAGAPEPAGEEPVMGVPTYADIDPQDTELLSEKPYLPLADVTLVWGEGSIGKGRMLCSVIADVTRGRPVGLSTISDDPGDVIVVLPEDKPGEQVVKRLIAAGADRRRVHDLTRLPGGGRFKLSASPKDPGHLPILQAFIGALRAKGRSPRLVVIDPVAAAIGEGTILTNKGARAMIEPLQDMADATGVAVVLVAHPTKGGVLQGSAGLEQAARLVYRVSRDPENAAHRTMKATKANNLPPEFAEDLKFTITADEAGRPRVVWLDRAAIDQRGQSWRDELAERRKARAAAAEPQPVQSAAATGTEGSRALLERAKARHAARLLARVTGSRR